MTPKDKAQILMQSFYSANQPYCFELSAAKKSALICVNEVLSNMYNTNYSKEDTRHPNIKYWQEVKQEIENY